MRVSKARREVIEKGLIPYWQKVLGLLDLRISVEYVDTCPTSAQNVLEIEHGPRGHDDPVMWHISVSRIAFVAYTRTSQFSEAIAHELIHTLLDRIEMSVFESRVLAPVQIAALRAPFDLAMHEVVYRFERAIVEAAGHPDWLAKDMPL